MAINGAIKHLVVIKLVVFVIEWKYITSQAAPRVI